MAGDKHGSKSGRYVGGFLQLFDWNAKSRKKLFPSKSDLPEQPKQGKKGEGNYPMTRMRVVDEDDFEAGFNFRGGSEYSYASSVTDDDGYGTKAPGVVARLMGLDSLPTANAMEPYSSPFFDSQSLPEAPYRGRNLDMYHDNQVMQSNHLFHKNALDSRAPKMPNRPIEKFQTEKLPQKSAKTIPITHHKLLSPIKSPIFVPSQDAAHIMEAAARIIEPGLHAAPRAKISSGGSTSVPFKVRELREKLEAVHRPSKVVDTLPRPVESNAAKYLRGQLMNKSWNGAVETAQFKVSPSRDDSASASKNKSKSISLAIQAKVNVQKRERLTSSSKSFGGSEEQEETMSSQSSRNQSSNPKISNRKALNQSASSVLRQNNQKQNCPPYRDKSVLKSSVSNSTGGRKAISEDVTHGRHKGLSREAGTSRTSSRKSSLQARDSSKGAPYSGARNATRKRRSIDGGLQCNRNQVTDDRLANKHEKPTQSNMSTDKQFAWIEESRRKGMDVVSFTFNAPITRSLPGSEPLRQFAEKNTNLFTDDRTKLLMNSDMTRLSSPGFSGIKGDALSMLLEQKLKELASNLGSPHSFAKAGTATESDRQTVTSPGTVESAIGKDREKRVQRELRLNEVDRQIGSGLFTNEPEPVRRKFNFQAGEAVEDHDMNRDVSNQQGKLSHLPSPVSTLEPSMLTESCYSSESMASSSTEDSKPCSSVVAQEVVGTSSVRNFQPMPSDTLDSASSTPFQIIDTKDSMKSVAWELAYVKDILWNVELLFKDYLTGRTREIVNPYLFDQMERRRVKELKLERKVLFDCVSECLNLKCQRFVGGGFSMWTKGIATMKRKERLAEEVHKEIQGWRSLENGMVDELVDRDMSSKYGRWLDFEVDEFSVGVEIEGEILDDLVVEIVADMLPCRLFFP